MAWSKRNLVLGALREIGVAQRDVDMTADEVQDGVMRLDALMGDWNAKGIHIGYPLTSDPVVDVDQVTGVTAQAARAVILNLACELAPGYGRQILPRTQQNAKDALSTLQSLVSAPSRLRLPGGVPLGAGNRRDLGILRPFSSQPADPITVGEDSELEFG